MEPILTGPIFPTPSFPWAILRFLVLRFCGKTALCAVILLRNFLMEKAMEGDSRILSLVGENVPVASSVGSLNLFWRKVVFTSVFPFILETFTELLLCARIWGGRGGCYVTLLETIGLVSFLL